MKKTRLKGNREMEIQKDGSQQFYIDVPSTVGEHVRLTLTKPSQDFAAGQSCVRIQIRKENGQLFPGPEIPESVFYECMEAAKCLLG